MKKKSLLVWTAPYLDSVVRHLVHLPHPNEDSEDMEESSETNSLQSESGKSTPSVLRVPKRKNSTDQAAFCSCDTKKECVFLSGIL